MRLPYTTEARRVNSRTSGSAQALAERVRRAQAAIEPDGVVEFRVGKLRPTEIGTGEIDVG